MGTVGTGPDLLTATRLMTPATAHNEMPPAGRPTTGPDPVNPDAAPRPGRSGGWLAAGLTAAMFWASFPPLDFSVLGWVCLVPLVLLVRLRQTPRGMYMAVTVAGSVAMLGCLHWMPLGDTWMIPAWLALSLYAACYFSLFVAMSRVAVHRLGVPLSLGVPVVWVGLEYARGHVMTGFGWFFLAHTQYRWIELIQVSDLVGAYGVSFIVAMVAAVLAGCVPEAGLRRLGLVTPASEPPGDSPKRRLVAVVAALASVAAAVGYGTVRRGQADFKEGPRIALIQGNFTSQLKRNPDPEYRAAVIARHRLLTQLAVREGQPDLVVWPETMYRWPLLETAVELTDDELRRCAPNIPPEVWRKAFPRNQLADFSSEANAALIIGIDTLVASPGRLDSFNSAAFIRPDTGLAGRYDKLHRVPFGEYIPLADTLPWLHHLTPFPADFGLTAGRTASVFEYGSWRFVPMICFEDTVPHIVGQLVRAAEAAGKPADCLVNLTNDGWFHGSSELDQHLITSVFRAIECRTPLVRAVNTGISAVIDGDGVIVEPDHFIDGDAWLALEELHRDDSLSKVEKQARIESIKAAERTSLVDPATGRWRRQLNCALVDAVPLDNRRSLYLATGDWFAGSCSLACLALLLVGVSSRFRPPRKNGR